MQNSPNSYSKLSQAEIIMSKKLSDALPYLPIEKMFVVNKSIDFKWRELWRLKETALLDRFIRNMEDAPRSDRKLKPLQVGQYFALQNQQGSKPLRWNRTGVIVMCMDFDQYIVKVHGSNRLTRRNRRFLRAYDPPAGLQFRIPSALPETSLNKGAGDVGRGHVQVDDAQRQPLGDVSAEDERDMPTAEENGPSVCDTNGDSCAPQAEEIGLRRSARSNKGKSTRLKDFVTGMEYEDAVWEASKD